MLSRNGELTTDQNSLANAYAALEKLIDEKSETACEIVMAGFPQLAEQTDCVLELIYLEFVLRRERGQTPALQEFQARFPSFGDEISSLLRVDSVIGGERVDSTLPTGDPTDTLAISTTHASLKTVGRIGDYQLLEKIGRGGMGLVYRAVQRRLGRTVALKTVDIIASFDRDVTERFQSEAGLAARLQHPNIVQIFEIGSHLGVPYYSMELVTGGTLADATANQPLHWRTAAQVTATLARAVGYAHQQGIIHRDLKPANVLLAPSQRSEGIDLESSHNHLKTNDLAARRIEPKIADFGLAKSLEVNDHRTVTGAMLGTPSFMAPEQISAENGAVGPACDIYSLGAILYDLLVGRPPFYAATAFETLRQVREEDPIPLRQLQSSTPRELETICLKCLSKHPSARYATADELADDLERFLNGVPILARTAGVFERLTKWTRRNPSLAGMFAAIFIALISITWLWRGAEFSREAERLAREQGEQLLYNRDISLAHSHFKLNNIERCRELLDNSPPDFRGWEWHYLRNMCQQAVWESPGNEQPITSVALSPDGRFVALGFGRWGYNHEQAIEVWDTWQNKLKWQLRGHPAGQVCCVQFSPDGTKLISSAFVWQAPTSKGGVMLWDLTDGSLVRKIADVNAYVTRFCNRGASVLVGASTGMVTQFNCQDGRQEREFQGNMGMVLDIALSPDGRQFAASGRDGSFTIFEIDSGTRRQRLLEQVDPRRLEWSGDGRKVLLGGYGGSVKTFQIGSEQITLVNEQHRSSLPYMKTSPDGRWLATGVLGDGADIRDWRTGRVLEQYYGHGGHIRSLDFDASGRRLVTAGVDGTAQVWDLNRKVAFTRKARVKNLASVSSIAYRPGSSQFAVATIPTQTRSQTHRPLVEIRDMNTLALLRSLEGHTDWLTVVDFRADGRQLLSAGRDSTVRVWNPDDGSEILVLRGHNSTVVAAAFVGSGDQIVSVDTGGIIHVYNAKDSTLVHTWDSQMRDVVSATLHANQQWVALATKSGEICWWDLRLGKQICSRQLDRPLSFVTLSPDGARFATPGSRGDIEIWDTLDFMQHSAPHPIMKLIGHRSAVTSVSFSPDGRRLSSTGRDEAVRVFDLALGYELLTLECGKGVDNVVKFSLDGQQLLRSESMELVSWNIVQPVTNLPVDPGDYEASMVNWHKYQLKAALTERNDHAAIFHRTALIRLEPSKYEYYSYRATSKLNIGDWQGAEEDLQIGLKHKDTVSSRTDLASICLHLGKLDEYQQHCQRLVELAEASQNAMDLNSAAWLCSLSPYSGVDCSRFIPGLEASLAKKPAPLILNTLALVHYRCGNFDRAIDAARQGIRLDWQVSAPWDWLVIALAKIRQEIHASGTAAKEVSSDEKDSQHYAQLVVRWSQDQSKRAAAGLEVSASYHLKVFSELQRVYAELGELVPRKQLPELSAP